MLGRLGIVAVLLLAARLVFCEDFDDRERLRPSRDRDKAGNKSEEIIGNKKTPLIAIGDGICHSVDIRNDVKNFQSLENCRVIEGFLQIVLLEKSHELDYENWTFPQLREISGYFVLYRVAGLKTLGNLFPNLEIIRGDMLITDYSFMIFENPHLQELGLTKLSQISRGGARISGNPSLCYTAPNWDSIVVAGETVIKENQREASCPGCSDCPNSYCWSSNHCLEKPIMNCHPLCFGECTGTTESDCYVCKNFRHEGKCIESCPDDLYTYSSRRCITKDECLTINKISKSQKGYEEETLEWRPFNGSCVFQCPQGFEDKGENDTLTCHPCQGHCRKEIKGAVVRHMSDLRKFRGTTIVKGSLEFQIDFNAPNVMDELTECFGLIEEITETLKIAHSLPITSLYFFRSLKVIGGEKQSVNNSSIIVIDNPNLSELFPQDQDISVKNGRFFFHYNPKLCLWKIREFGRKVGVLNSTDIEVQPVSNGDKVACDIVGMTITVVETGPNFANISWSDYVPQRGQQLLSYLLNYIETNDENIAYEMSSCGNVTWEVVDVNVPKNPKVTEQNVVQARISNLKPYTKYAAFVKTFSASSKKVVTPVGQSKIIFFHTKNNYPSVPLDVHSFSVSDSEIIVKWSPPEHPNGPIGNYIIAGFLRFDDPDLPRIRDYCEYDLEEETEVAISVPEVTESPRSCCRKDSSGKATLNSFEKFCHDNVTLNHLPASNNYCVSHRYHIEETDFQDLVDHIPQIAAMDKKVEEVKDVLDDRKTRIFNGVYYSFVYNASVKNQEFILTKLKHFSLYTISVQVCSSRINGVSLCSPIQYTNTRTSKNPGADEVKNVKVRVHNSTVSVFWDPVKDPNSLTVAYVVQFINVKVQGARKVTECIPDVEDHRRGRSFSHHIRNLSPGTYSLRVRSKSLAGDGECSEEVKFTVGLSEDSNITTIVLFILVLLTFGTLIGIYGICQYQRKKRLQERLIASVNPDYVSSTYVPDFWEVPRDSIELLDDLGLGNFGMVRRGLLNGSSQVAVKTISENATNFQRNEFLNEASVMKNFDTFHIVKLLGVVSDGNPPYVIMELMENGDLKSYLRNSRDGTHQPDAARMVRMAAEIADGMAYLESKKFIHRDLAARNCMLSNDLVCKIGDFGMARDIYETDYYKVGQKGLLPIRWMAPENLSDGVFTSDSDVWSFGVVLYEIVMLGELPYQGYSNEDVINHVLHKGKLVVSNECPEILGKILEKCFRWRPHERLTFMEIVGELEPFLGQDFCERSFYHSEEACNQRSLGVKKAYHQPAMIRFNWGTETARWVKEFEDNVTLLDQGRGGSSKGRIFKNGFQQLGNSDDVRMEK